MFNIREIDYDKEEYERLREKQTASEEIFDGVILHVFRDKVELPNGDASVREVIAHVEAVCVVPVDSDGNVILERQYRYPIDAVITEIPAGKLDYEGEDHLEAAKRELREETGITAADFEYIGPFYPTCAYSTEVIHLYFAWNLTFGERELDDDENINVEMMDIREVADMILRGLVPDGKTQTAVLKVLAKL